jgi:hypothetical protein
MHSDPSTQGVGRLASESNSARTLRGISGLDQIVIRAWELSVEDYTDEVYATFEELVPILEAAG